MPSICRGLPSIIMKEDPMSSSSTFGDGGLALKMMKAQGWKQGQGLGKSNHGVCEPVKASMKFDQSGLGHDRAQEFTHHWWDIAFNKAAQTIKVTQDENGEVNLNMERKLTKKEKKARQRKAKRDMYSQFVQAATLSNGDLVPVNPEQKDASADESDDEAEALDRLAQSKALNLLTDEELFKACGGLTAHKGARHGHKMTAKHNRVAAMEAQYLADLEAKAAKAKREKDQQIEEKTRQEGIDVLEAPIEKKKRKKKKAQKDKKEDELEKETDISGSKEPYEPIKGKKRKKSANEGDHMEADIVSFDDEMIRKKKKKEAKKLRQLGPIPDLAQSDVINEGVNDESIKKMKKKKKKINPDHDY